MLGLKAGNPAQQDAYGMTRILKFILALFLFSTTAFSSRASTVICALTNWVPGTYATNAIKLTPIGKNIGTDGSYGYVGPSIWLYGTTNGLYTNQLDGGNWEAAIDIPDDWDVPRPSPILFRVPMNDTNTWTLWQLRISGGSFFVTQILPGGSNILGSANVIVTPSGGNAVVSLPPTISSSTTGNASTATVAGSANTLSGTLPTSQLTGVFSGDVHTATTLFTPTNCYFGITNGMTNIAVMGTNLTGDFILTYAPGTNHLDVGDQFTPSYGGAFNIDQEWIFYRTALNATQDLVFAYNYTGNSHAWPVPTNLFISQAALRVTDASPNPIQALTIGGDGTLTIIGNGYQSPGNSARIVWSDGGTNLFSTRILNDNDGLGSYWAFDGAAGAGNIYGGMRVYTNLQAKEFQLTRSALTLNNINLIVNSGSVTASSFTGTVSSANLSGIISTSLLGTGTASSSTFLRGDGTWATPSGSGSVTSVGMSGDGTVFNSTITGSPITSSGTLAPSLKTQSAHSVLAGPATGTAAPTFRALAAGDIPTALNGGTTFDGGNITTSSDSSGTITAKEFATPVFGQVIDDAGNLFISSSPPSSSSDPGTTGQITWDSDYIYVYTGSGWKRAALSTW